MTVLNYDNESFGYVNTIYFMASECQNVKVCRLVATEKKAPEGV